jgi:aconitate hydratase
MGVLPLQFADGDSAESLGLAGEEVFEIHGISDGIEVGERLEVTATREGGDPVEFTAITRIDTPVEREYYRHGGILPYVLRQLRG